MSQTGLAAFDSTMHMTNLWLAELMERQGWVDRQRAYHALRTVLHALRDRLPVELTVDLGAQLPMLVRGFYYEGWHPHGKPVKERKKEEFLAHIIDPARPQTIQEVESMTRAVLQLLAKHVTPGEIGKIKQALPAEIRDLWS